MNEWMKVSSEPQDENKGTVEGVETSSIKKYLHPPLRVSYIMAWKPDMQWRLQNQHRKAKLKYLGDHQPFWGVSSNQMKHELNCFALKKWSVLCMEENGENFKNIENFPNGKYRGGSIMLWGYCTWKGTSENKWGRIIWKYWINTLRH